MKLRLALGLALSLSLVPACGAEPPPSEPPGPVANHVERVATTEGVPTALVLAIAAVEQGLALPRFRSPSPDDHVPVAGILELRHGSLNTLALGAKLMGSDERSLQADTDLGTEAGIRVLASLGPRGESRVAAWRAAIAELSGLSGRERERYVAEVFRVLYFGGSFPARDGERVRVAPHPEIPPAYLITPPPSHLLAPDFPGSEWFATDCNGKCTDNRPDGNASVDTILVHDTEGGWNASVATLQFDAGKSVHYIIDADGSRWGQFIPETYTGWHAGNWCYNKHSIGIEHVGFVSNKDGYATALYQKSAEMVLNIKTRWPTLILDRDHVVGHYQVPNGTKIAECGPPCSDGLDACEKNTSYGGASHHTDPGYQWQWCQYMELLGASCHCNDAWPLWNCTNDHTQAWRCNSGSLEKQVCAEGCDVMPSGQNDVCHEAPDAGAGGASGAAGAPAGGGGGTAGSSSGGAGGSTTQPDAGSATGGKQTKKAAEDDLGCACRAAPRRETPWAALTLLLLALRRRGG
ncbi:MAG: N-acetylmuramoyl-L-alanine amidase [Myxococcales bacterium]|nr:N-acetylmuramoyl-L-alanine amidase [Myxococcales bacterium]